MKRFSQIVADRDTILKTILATSVKQNSNKVFITASYNPSQTALYRKLLNTADIAVEDVSYVEIHGTDTPIDDPLKYEAIKKVFDSKSRREPLLFFSVKGNIAHNLLKELLMWLDLSKPF